MSNIYFKKEKVKKQPKKIKPEREKKKRLVDWFGKTIEEKNERKKRKKPTIIPLIVFQSQKNLLLFTKDLQSFFKKKKISWKYPNLYNLQVAKKGLEFKILLTELFNDPNSNRIKIKIIYKKGSEKYFKNIGNQILKKIK
ncbi:hypothetical protein M0811_04482 [Anaeramoeba ignava]|uniref:Uncharacterized protein n=1 Tax=Anaeramoeba ignava TaxID=1746090 RepID=A0A9Q0LT66_ANAIG|nr:hypothetical protein M0811_04482 [Anaeramoeba ignava]